MTSILTPNNAEETVQKRLGGIVVRSAGDFRDASFFALLYGQGGAGKTTLAADLHKLGKTCLVDVRESAGVDAISHLADKVDIVKVANYREYKAVAKDIKAGGHGYDNIIIDNIVELSNQSIVMYAGGPLDQPEIQEYFKANRDVLFEITELRTAAQNGGFNVIVSCWDSDEKDEKGVLKKDLALTPQLRKEIPGVITIVGHVQVLNDPRARKLTFAPSPKTVAKFRRSADSAAQKVPFDVFYRVDNLPLADIVRTIRGEIEWPEKKYPPLTGSAST